MSMFGATKDGTPTPLPRSGGREPNLSILAAGTRITGALETEGFLRVEGRVEGDLRAEGQVLVSPGGVVEGNIKTRQAVVAGEVNGEILAEESVELKAGCQVNGNISTPRITVEEGGAVNGELRMSGKANSMSRVAAVVSHPEDGDPPTSEKKDYEKLRSVS